MTPAGKVKAAQPQTTLWRVGTSPYPASHHQAWHIAPLLSSCPRDTRAAPSEPPQKGSHEKHEAAGPGGTLLPRCEIPQSFPTRKQRELGLGFSKSAARHQTSVWHQLGANCCAPSVGEPAAGPRTISAGFPVGFIFRSPGRQSAGRAVSSAPAGPAPRRPSARSRRWSTPLPWLLDLQGRARHTG